MTTEQPWKPDNLPELPGFFQSLAPDEIFDEPSELSKFRTRMSEHRTTLSEKRTTLSDVRSQLSNERTHLSQIRTAISLMSFGVTLNRFSIYLEENGKGPTTTGRGLAALQQAEYVGAGMVGLGIAVMLWSLWRYKRVQTEIETHSFTSPDLAVTFLTVTIILLGAGSALWMITG